MSPSEALKHFLALCLYYGIVHGQFYRPVPGMNQMPAMYQPRPYFQDLARPYYLPSQNYPAGISPRGFPGMYPYVPPIFTTTTPSAPVVKVNRKASIPKPRKVITPIYKFHKGDIIDYEYTYDSMPPEEELNDRAIVTFIKKYKKAQKEPRKEQKKIIATSNNNRFVHTTETIPVEEVTEDMDREKTQEEIDDRREGEVVEDTNEIPPLSNEEEIIDVEVTTEDDAVVEETTDEEFIEEENPDEDANTESTEEKEEELEKEEEHEPEEEQEPEEESGTKNETEVEATTRGGLFRFLG